MLASAPMPYPDPPHSPPFRCPICRSGAFQNVEVKRPDGRAYRTEFLQCAGCSVMFRDSVKFTRFEPYKVPEKTEAQRRSDAQRVAYFHKGDGDR